MCVVCTLAALVCIHSRCIWDVGMYAQVAFSLRACTCSIVMYAVRSCVIMLQQFNWCIHLHGVCITRFMCVAWVCLCRWHSCSAGVHTHFCIHIGVECMHMLHTCDVYVSVLNSCIICWHACNGWCARVTAACLHRWHARAWCIHVILECTCCIQFVCAHVNGMRESCVLVTSLHLAIDGIHLNVACDVCVYVMHVAALMCVHSLYTWQLNPRMCYMNWLHACADCVYVTIAWLRYRCACALCIHLVLICIHIWHSCCDGVHVAHLYMHRVYVCPVCMHPFMTYI